MANISKFLLFFNEIRANFIKNSFNVVVIAGGIIKNKISKLYFLNAIFLDNLYHLLCNDFSHMQLYDFLITNKHCLKMNIIINIICHNNNKSNKIYQYPEVKKEVDIAFSLIYVFG